MFEDRGAESAVFAAEAEVGLDAPLPHVEGFLHLAAEDLTELGVDSLDVGSHGCDHGEEYKEGDRKRGHGF